MQFPYPYGAYGYRPTPGPGSEPAGTCGDSPLYGGSGPHRAHAQDPYSTWAQGTSGGYAPPGLGGQSPYGWRYPPPGPPPLGARETKRRRDHRRLFFAGVVAVVVAVAFGAGIGIGVAITPTSPSTTAQALFNKSLSAAEHAGTFHYVSLSITNGQPDNIIGDASPDGGRQAITERGPSGIDIFHLRLVDGVIYFRGNAPAVVDQLGVPESKALSVMNRWVKITRGERPYGTFAVGITTKSNLSQLPTTFVPQSTQTVAGSSPPSTRIVGAIASPTPDAPTGTANFVVNSSSSLPKTLSAQAVNATTGAHLSLSWTFSRWRQPVNVAAPAGAIAYSSLGTSSS